MSKIKNDGLDQYGTGPFEQQQVGTTGIEGVNLNQFACRIDYCHLDLKSLRILSVKLEMLADDRYEGHPLCSAVLQLLGNWLLQFN